MSVDEPVMPPILLPMGPIHNNYTSVIRVAIADSLAASIYIDLQVRVSIMAMTFKTLYKCKDHTFCGVQ